MPSSRKPGSSAAFAGARAAAFSLDTDPLPLRAMPGGALPASDRRFIDVDVLGCEEPGCLGALPLCDPLLREEPGCITCPSRSSHDCRRSCELAPAERACCIAASRWTCLPRARQPNILVCKPLAVLGKFDGYVERSLPTPHHQEAMPTARLSLRLSQLPRGARARGSSWGQ